MRGDRNIEPESDPGQRIAARAPAKRAIVMQRAQGADKSFARDCIPRRDSRRPAPLSFGQERLWFLSALEPKNALYNLGKAYHLRGQLDVEALTKSIDEILRRHETLRTRFASEDGDLVQIVVPHGAFRLPVRDVTLAPPPGRFREALSWAEREVSRPFDLTAGPLMRVTLLRLNALEHFLVFAFHHIIFDGWSGAVFARELGSFYSAFTRGEHPAWPDLPIQYADYAAWQRSAQSDESLEIHLPFWRDQLAGASPSSLITDHPRPARPSYQGDRHFFALPQELTEKLARFNRNEKVTPFMSLFATFAALLYRWSGQTDIVVGTPIAHRLSVEVEELIGFFANMLVLRVNLDDEPSFRELVNRVRAVALDAFQHQELPFEKLVEQLNPSRDPSRQPLFQVAFALQSASEESLTLPGLEVARKFLRSTVSRFDVELHFLRDGNTWLGVLAYARELFDQATIEAMARQYVVLLDAALTWPDRSVSVVPMMTEDERNRVVVEWNATGTTYARDRCIHEVFEAEARRRPEAVAVVFGEKALSYGELDLRSSRLANHLRALGVGRGAKVALCVDASTQMTIGLLGILKAGAAYVPIDPGHPDERIGMVLADAEAAVVLASADHVLRFTNWPIRVVCLDRDWERTGEAAAAFVTDSPTAEDVAYVLFTSGSTGRPKGVCVPHRAVNHLVMNCDHLEIGPDDVVAQVSNLCFDAATFEIWGALLKGARLAGIARDDLLSAESFSRELRRHGVTTLLLTTALFNELVRERATIFSEVRNLLFGGEECDADTVRKILEGGGRPQRLFHAYGPTETTTFATLYEVRPERRRGRIPIGRPIANTRIYILDGHRNAVPVGVPGEIWIGGDGVASGYLGRPELTAERFVRGLFQSSGRLFRTGDRGRFLADGNIEFLGRLDDQVKIRGFRIEPGEIESALLAHPKVRHAAVCAHARTGGSEEKSLVAYVVLADGHNAPSTDELSAFLKRKMPDYMVPSAFVTLERLPLSSTGKIDRRALPAPVFQPETPDLVAPRNETEEMVAQAWAAVIDCDSIGVHENFFQLGGHSLLAMRVVSRLRSAAGLDVPLGVFFENATVAGLAEYIEGVRCTAGKTGVPAVVDREELIL